MTRNPTPPLAVRAASWALVLAGLAGLAASAALLVDYTGPVPAFCGEGGGGCDLVRASRFASWLGVPTPVFGVAFFGSVVALATAPGRRARAALYGLAAVGAFAAVALLATQAFVIRAFCSLCLVADVAALVIAAAALLARRAPVPTRWRSPALVAVLAVAAAGVPLALPRPAPAGDASAAAAAREATAAALPAAIVREQRPGVVTIVEFLDFQCPYCRELHGRLKEAVAPYGDRVRIVRKHRPIPSHRYAEGAARAAVCAEEAGHGDAMADALVEVPVESLIDEHIARLAAQLGVPSEAFAACMTSPRPAERVATDVADANAAGVRGVPVLWIGARRYEGAQPVEALRAGIEAALRDAG